MTLLPRRDAFLALIVIVIWAAHFFVIKAAVTQLDPMVALTIRFLVTTLIFAPFMRHVDLKTFIRVGEIGVLMGVLHQALLFVGLKHLDSASVSVLMQSQTVFAVIMGWWFLGEKFKWRTTLGLVVSFLGLIVMLGVPDVRSSPGGFAIIMASSIILSFSYIRMRKLPTVSPATFIAIINVVSCPLAFIGSLIFSGTDAWAHAWDADWTILAGVLAYQALVVSISHFIWQQLLSRNEVAKVTCFSLLTPPLTIAMAVALGAHVSLELLAGMALTMVGVAIIVIRRVQLHREGPVTLVE